MRSRGPLILALLLPGIGGMLAGYTAWQDPAKRPITQQQFDERLNALEERLLAHLAEVSSHHDTRTDRLDDELMTIKDDLKWIQHTQAIQAEKIGRIVREEENRKKTQVVQTGQAPSDQKVVLGRLEWVGFPTIGTYLKARIDSGANTSSLSARDITEYERDGEQWVRFKLALAEDEEDVVEAVRDAWIETPLLRRVRITQASGSESRPVVRLQMTLGPIRQEVHPQRPHRPALPGAAGASFHDGHRRYRRQPQVYLRATGLPSQGCAG